MKASAPGPRMRQASGEGSPQASPAMMVSRSPPTLAGLPARALSKRQAAFSGSTTTNTGRRAPCPSQSHASTAAAAPPMPPCTKTWVGRAPWASASATMTA
jgi:hypothetical protein